MAPCGKNLKGAKSHTVAKKKALLFNHLLMQREGCLQGQTILLIQATMILENSPSLGIVPRGLYSPACLDACAGFPVLGQMQRPFFEVCSKLKLETESGLLHKSSFLYKLLTTTFKDMVSKTAEGLEELLDLEQPLKRTKCFLAKRWLILTGHHQRKVSAIYLLSGGFDTPPLKRNQFALLVLLQYMFVTKSTGNCSFQQTGPDSVIWTMKIFRVKSLKTFAAVKRGCCKHL